MAVYMVRSGERGPVKIGWATNVESRIRTLQTAHHKRLVVVRIIDSVPIAEKLLHKHFSQNRISGEWFTFCAEMLSVDVEHLMPQPKVPYQIPEAAVAFSPEMQELIDAIRAFVEKTQTTKTALGKAAVNDGKIVDRVLSGKNITFRTFERLMVFMAQSDRSAA